MLWLSTSSSAQNQSSNIPCVSLEARFLRFLPVKTNKRKDWWLVDIFFSVCVCETMFTTYLNMIKRNKNSSHSQVPLTAILQMKCRSIRFDWWHTENRSKESTKKRPTAGLKNMRKKLAFFWAAVDCPCWRVPFQIEVKWWKRRWDWGTIFKQWARRSLHILYI